MEELISNVEHSYPDKKERLETTRERRMEEQSL